MKTKIFLSILLIGVLYRSGIAQDTISAKGTLIKAQERLTDFTGRSSMISQLSFITLSSSTGESDVTGNIGFLYKTNTAFNIQVNTPFNGQKTEALNIDGLAKSSSLSFGMQRNFMKAARIIIPAEKLPAYLDKIYKDRDKVGCCVDYEKFLKAMTLIDALNKITDSAAVLKTDSCCFMATNVKMFRDITKTLKEKLNRVERKGWDGCDPNKFTVPIRIADSLQMILNGFVDSKNNSCCNTLFSKYNSTFNEICYILNQSNGGSCCYSCNCDPSYNSPHKYSELSKDERATLEKKLTYKKLIPFAGFRIKAGKKSYDFFTDTTLRNTDSREVYEYEGKLVLGAQLTNHSSFALSGIWQQYYDPGDASTFNLPTTNTSVSKQQELYPSPPVQKTKINIQAEYRQIIANGKLAWQPIAVADLTNKILDARVQFYFLNLKEDDKFKGLNGGMFLGYRTGKDFETGLKKENFLVGIFFSPVFNITSY